MGGYQLSPVVRLGLILRFIYNCDLKFAYFIAEDYIKAWDSPYSVDPAVTTKLARLTMISLALTVLLVMF